MRSQEVEPENISANLEHEKRAIALFESLEINGNKNKFLEEMWAIPEIDKEDYLAIAESIRGNRTLVDKRLRDPSVKNKLWVVEVPDELGYEQRYAWTVASHDERLQLLQKLASEMYLNARTDHLLKCPEDYRNDTPPPINWLIPIRSSKMPQPPARDASRDEFYIFQVPKDSADEHIDDFDQALVLNSKLIEKGLELQKKRMRNVFNLNDPYTSKLVEYHNQNSLELAATHLELHNSGHFLGPIPFGNSKRDHKSYDFVEELRACLSGFRTAEINNLDEEKLEALGLQILGTRVMLHGYNAWRMPAGTRNRQEVREIVVGAMLWQRLIDDKSIIIENGLISIQPGGFKKSMTAALTEIHEAENTAIHQYSGKLDEALEKIAVGLLKATFNGKEYKKELLTVYDQIESV